MKELLNLPLIAPLKQRNYLLLFLGSALSYIGANLTFVAFPWLVLRVSGDPLAIGSVMALAGIPRAAFMLFGGALVDKYSARTMMIISTAARLALMLVMAIMTITETITLWQIFILAFLFGTLDAFYWPASSAIVPSILKAEFLPAGNALLQGSAHTSLMLGPLLAGLIISFAGSGEMYGIAMVFFLDTIGFLFSLTALVLIQLPKSAGDDDPSSINQLLKSLTEGLSAAWQDLPVRVLVVVLALFTLFFRGPHLVGIPVLADARFEEGALAFGMIMSSFGVGALIGIIAAGSLPALPERWLGRFFLLDLAVLGGSFVIYALTPVVELAMIASCISGLFDGYFIVIIISWLQRRTDPSLIGRVMSVIMFCINGLAPISAAATGWMLTLSLDWTFLGAGFILLALCAVGLAIPVVRQMGLSGEPKST